MNTKLTVAQLAEIKQGLQNTGIKEGDSLYFVCRHVSTTGMTRSFSVYYIHNNIPYNETYNMPIYAAIGSATKTSRLLLAVRAIAICKK